MELREIRPIDIQKWQNNLLSKYKNSYVRNMYGIFQMSLDRAVVLGLLEKNPAKVIGNVKKRKTTVDFGQRRIYKSYFNFLY
ncbi:hypothetical protein NWO25_14880 [Enterococcus lactis]|nr:hypothetical protein [Enterococcus lactis]